MSTKIQLRRDTAATWAATDPILAQGEVGIDLTAAEMRVGDGLSAWSLLPVIGSVDPADVDAAVAAYLAANPPAAGGPLDTEGVQDVVGAMVVGAGGTYDDAAGTITLPGGGGLVDAVVWDEAALVYPARPATATLVVWRGPADPRLIVGSGFVTDIDLWAVNSMDSAAPSVVTNLAANPDVASVALSWTAATDDIAVTGYEYRIGAGAWVDAGAGTSETVTGLTASTAYTFGVRAYDAIGHKGAEVTVSTTTDAVAVPDTTAPTVPAGLSATATSSTTVDLSWSASTDAGGVTGYEYAINAGAAVDAGAGTTETVSGLTASTLYSFTVRAYDAAGNRSAWSTAATATTYAATVSPLFTDFSEYTTGAAPSDWTLRWVTTGAAATVADDAGATGGKVLQFTRTSTTGRSFLSWDDIPTNQAQVEIVAKFKSSVTDPHPLRVHGSGAASSESGYFALFGEDAVVRSAGVLQKYAGGTSTELGSTAHTFTLDAYYWVRLRVESGAVKMRWWADGEAEPATWQNESADTTHTSGWAGVGAFNVGTITVDVFGAAWGGGTAPKSA